MSTDYDEEAPGRKESPTIQASKATKDNAPIDTKTPDGVGEIGNDKTKTASSIPVKLPNKQQQHLAGSQSNIKPAELRDSSIKYPEDSYSFIALNGPSKGKPQTLQRTLFFLFGLLPFVFQIVLLVLLAYSQTNELNGTIGETDNPDQDKEGVFGLFARFTPANSTPIIRVAQVTSLAVYLIFPDSSITDIARSVQLFPYSSKNQESAVGYMRLSCILRLTQGVTAIVATLLLVLRSTTVVDIILNFTAVNFISDLDDYAFTLAKNGEFSPSLREEAERISEIDLPPCMFKSSESKWKCYQWVAAAVAIFFLAVLSSVFGFQDSKEVWVTKLLRVQFQDSTGLDEYSGCFGMNTASSLVEYSRRTYHSFDTGPLNTSIGYCREDRQWILFKGDYVSNPCEARNISLARSSKTDTFDISSMFEESWVSASNTPLDLYFFENETAIEENCNLTLGDGVCDPAFNELGYDFDGGDCCAATCTKSNCGIGGLTEVFGNPEVPGDGYGICKDPSMVPITIHLNNVTSSRDSQITGWNSLSEVPTSDWWLWDYDENRFKDWMNTGPVPTYLSLDCNGRNVMTAILDNTMINQSQTVMVEDGSKCSLVVRNATSNLAIIESDPIWYIDYTIFHDNVIGVNATSRVEILSGHSFEVEAVNFTRIPECYFERLGDDIEIQSIYTGNSSSIQAVDWLLKDPDPKQQCEDPNFLERFALVAMDFAIGSSTNRFIAREEQCRWQSIACIKGKVVSIQLRNKGLQGDVPTELGFISDLQRLRLGSNQLVSLPKEIGNLTSLQGLYLANNDLASLPKEIANLSSLQQLSLNDNQLTSMPTEIGNLSSLQQLDLWRNQLKSLPTEIGNLTSLQELYLEINELVSLPPEIGNLTSLQYLNLANNDLASLPKEIGNLTSLQGLYLDENQLKSLPTEIGNLSSLQFLYYDSNVIIPEEVRSLCDSSVDC